MSREMKIGSNPSADAKQTLMYALKESDDQQEKEFIKHLLDALDFASYHDLQQWHLKAKSKPAKFLDLSAWMRHKFALAKHLGLHKSPPRRILDIGCGPSHFGVVGRYFGHEVIGLDVPANALYGDLNDFYNIRRFVHPVRAMRPLPGDLGRFDMITALSANFYQKEDDTLFTVEDWKFFMKNIVSSHINSDGEIFFNLNPLADHQGMHFWDDEFAQLMEGAGGTVDRQMGHVRFVDISRWLQ